MTGSVMQCKAIGKVTIRIKAKASFSGWWVVLCFWQIWGFVPRPQGSVLFSLEQRTWFHICRCYYVQIQTEFHTTRHGSLKLSFLEWPSVNSFSHLSCGSLQSHPWPCVDSLTNALARVMVTQCSFHFFFINGTRQDVKNLGHFKAKLWLILELQLWLVQIVSWSSQCCLIWYVHFTTSATFQKQDWCIYIEVMLYFNTL